MKLTEREINLLADLLRIAADDCDRYAADPKVADDDSAGYVLAAAEYRRLAKCLQAADSVVICPPVTPYRPHGRRKHRG